ncbi:MAG: hypothetical protein FWF25_07460 [Propionibacteriaceae bacterium]|nr:hypothetical protein [Propionibacteriaceae bacterium]
MKASVPRISEQDALDDLTDHWRQLNKEIARIESHYPLIVTTIVTLFVGILATQNTTWFRPLRDVAPYLVPGLVLLGLSYILSLTRSVAIIRGYSAFIEDEINRRRSDQLYLWNSKYIGRFVQNNAPNKQMMILNGLLALACLYGIIVFLSQQHLWHWLGRWYNIMIYCTVAALLVWIIIGFAKNDGIREESFRFALFTNHPEQEALVPPPTHRCGKARVCKSRHA